MSDQHPKAATIAAHAGGIIDSANGSVVPAIHPSTTFVRDSDYRLTHPENKYLRDDNDVVRQAQNILAKLEQAKAQCLLLVDSTASTPILCKPLSLGADIVMHSASKAINGHSDVLAGALVTHDIDSPVWQAIKVDRRDAGAVMGPFEAWLLVRGMRTLPLRIERMCQNSLAIAEFLDTHPNVEAVLYPGLPNDPGHQIAKTQMQGGFGCLLSFLVKGDRKQALSVAGRLELFLRATSLGGVESLVEHRHTIESHTGIPENLLRLSVGIEDVSDLMADLDQALSAS